MFKKIALALVVIVIAFVGYVATRPADFTIMRTRTIAAPPGVVHGYVNDFKKWAEWSPWEKLDPTMNRELSGQPSGPGSVYYWKGNDKVGEGRMTITDSLPPKTIAIRLEFLKPFQATNTTEFHFESEGNGTKVTWAMSGHNNFVSKAMCVFMDMDKMVGSDFEKGLAQLEAATTAKPAAPAAPVISSGRPPQV